MARSARGLQSSLEVKGAYAWHRVILAPSATKAAKARSCQGGTHAPERQMKTQSTSPAASSTSGAGQTTGVTRDST